MRNICVSFPKLEFLDTKRLNMPSCYIDSELESKTVIFWFWLKHLLDEHHFTCSLLRHQKSAHSVLQVNFANLNLDSLSGLRALLFVFCPSWTRSIQLVSIHISPPCEPSLKHWIRAWNVQIYTDIEYRRIHTKKNLFWSWVASTSPFNTVIYTHLDCSWAWMSQITCNEIIRQIHGRLI